VDTVLPDPLRLMMLLGAIIIPCLFSLLEMTHRRFHLYTLVGISIVLAYIAGFAFTLDYPFSGDVSVSKDPYTKGPLSIEELA
jgi:hypothetical protein